MMQFGMISFTYHAAFATLLNCRKPEISQGNFMKYCPDVAT